jgi:uncharacterized protein YjaZ
LGEASPGNIGTFIGWRMVESYLKKDEGKTNLKKLMEMPAQKIFNESSYKPR